MFTTALAFTMWVDGVARVRVQHSAILGLLSAVASPVFAFLLLGQGLSAWAVAGGALILASGAARGAARRRRAGAGAAAVAEPAPASPCIARRQDGGRDLDRLRHGGCLVARHHRPLRHARHLGHGAGEPAARAAYAIAVVAILTVLGRPRRPACLRQRELWPRLLLMGFFDAVALLFYFYAVREAGVAVATVFLFSQPVWIAILAPRILKSRTERWCTLAIAIALVGLGSSWRPP